MSEFKGTKGTWLISNRYFVDKPDSKCKWKIIYTTNISNAIAEVKGIHHGNSDEETKANALLISKAPEMLEMLNELRQIFDYYSVSPESQFFKYKDRLEKLINEATQAS